MSVIDSTNTFSGLPPKPASPIPSPPAGKEMRTWRVGSLSMGITLILIGTALAVSIWQDAEAYELLLWVAPIVFILLGAELLVHLKLSRNPNMFVKYDWMSVFFVGLMGAASLVVAALITTGLLDEWKDSLQMKHRTAIIETVSEKLPDEVSRIVLQSSLHVGLERSDSRDIHLMGQIRYWAKDPIGDINSELIRTNIVGDTMYIIVGSPERRDGGLVTDAIIPMLMLAIPEDVQIEYRH